MKTVTADPGTGLHPGLKLNNSVSPGNGAFRGCFTDYFRDKHRPHGLVRIIRNKPNLLLIVLHAKVNPNN